MREIVFPAGGPARIAEAPPPEPGSGRLLVRTEAVGAGLVRMLEPGNEVRPGGETVGTAVAALAPSGDVNEAIRWWPPGATRGGLSCEPGGP